MPTYDYHCHANGRTLAVRHRMSDSVSTWGELCRLADCAPDGTPADATVEKVFTTSNVVKRESLGSGGAPAACGTGACGGGVCPFQ